MYYNISVIYDITAVKIVNWLWKEVNQLLIKYKSLAMDDCKAPVIRIGFEPMACCLEGSCSIQLSYRTK